MSRPKWRRMDPSDLPHHQTADEAMRRADGSLLLKYNDHSYAYLEVGKWVLFGPTGKCLGHQMFEGKGRPPLAWANKKIEDDEWVDLL